MENFIVDGVLSLKFDIFQAAALGAIVYYTGVWLRLKIPVLIKLSIPAPVIGGLPIAIITAILSAKRIVHFEFDNTLQNVFMICFFCTVGMNASYKLVIKGGILIAAFWGVSALVALLQNCIGIPIALAFGLNPLMGLIGGSIPMIGGLGTAGAFGALFENEYGIPGALSAAVACATFGMVAGSLVGGPLGEWIIKRHKLTTPQTIKQASLLELHTEQEQNALLEEVGEIAKTSAPADPISDDHEDKVSGPHLMKNISWLLVAVGVGSALSYYLKDAGLTLPPYIGAMIAAIVIRNFGDKSGLYIIDSKAIGMIGDITLALFITMAINSLELASLVNLALPLIVMMVLQIVLIVISAYFLVFRLFGKNYDSAVMAAGLCGFGLGATPNALVCMQVITKKHGASGKAFFVIPIVGSFIVDVSNTGVISILAGLFR
ncbi:MAG: hypothetical protein LBV68_01060 [Spirochaetaceae bacterium]|jgi:ESS family glutamate:Na+ symporter|nr:hypothetical protein [Spirochaetaceae bacterium]